MKVPPACRPPGFRGFSLQEPTPVPPPASCPVVRREKAEDCGVGVNSDTVGQVCDDVGLHQLAEELLLLGYIMCPRLWENDKNKQESDR